MCKSHHHVLEKLGECQNIHTHSTFKAQAEPFVQGSPSHVRLPISFTLQQHTVDTSGWEQQTPAGLSSRCWAPQNALCSGS
jgi:hypothetical protein